MDAAATRATWETIGPSYARARRRPWNEVLAWAEREAPPGARVLDLACGNGRHTGALAERGRHMVGADFARTLLADAARRAPGRVVAGDAAELPFTDAAFDAALFVAALHNIPGRLRRLAALAELRRVLKPGAAALVTVWNRWHPTQAAGFLAEIPYRLLGDHEIELGDRWVEWDTGRERVARFYHFYGRGELREDLRAAGFEVESLEAVAIARRYPDNLFASVRKR